MEQLLITRDQAADALSISVDTLDRLVGKGYIRREKIGTRTLYDRMEVIRFSEELKKKGAIRLA